jgi:AcrR family transcriptional regulator
VSEFSLRYPGLVPAKRSSHREINGGGPRPAPRRARAATVAPAEPRARAAALPPLERRAAIVAATVPLLIAHGLAVTTRQIAEASGIAEGTIFRVFPDKDAVIDAAVAAAFDSAPLVGNLRAIDLTQPIEARLTAAVEIFQRHVTNIWQLLAAVEMTRPPTGHGPGRERPIGEDSAMAALFEPDRQRLRCDPVEAGQLLRGLIIGCTHPAIVTDPLGAEEIVSMLLDGIRSRTGRRATTRPSARTRARPRRRAP